MQVTPSDALPIGGAFAFGVGTGGVVGDIFLILYAWLLNQNSSPDPGGSNFPFADLVLETVDWVNDGMCAIEDAK